MPPSTNCTERRCTPDHVLTGSGEADRWGVSAPTNRDELMRRVLALHAGGARVERETLPAGAELGTANPSRGNIGVFDVDDQTPPEAPDTAPA